MNGFCFTRACGRSLWLLATFCLMGWAQTPQVFVSAQTGVDGSGCSALTPCRTITHALTQVTDGGKIVLTDSGNYDQTAININKSVTVLAAPGTLPVISVGQSGNANFNISLGNTVSVSLRGLVFDGRGLTQNGIRGTANLTIENCVFENFTGHGIFLNGAAALQMTDSHVRHSGGGVLIQPNGTSKTVKATLNLCHFTSLTGSGLEFRTSITNTVQALVQDCVVNGNGTAATYGALATANSGGTVQVMANGLEVTKFDIGLLASGNGSVMRVARSMIVRNNTGVAGNNSGQMLSRANNTVESNTTNGTFTSTFAGK